jgi:hypothetical protein
MSRMRLATALLLLGATMVGGWGCRAFDPAWAADAKSSPSKTTKVFPAPPSRVGPALMESLDEVGIRIDHFAARDDQQGTVLDLETTREDQRQPGSTFRNTEILGQSTRFAKGVIGPDLLDGEVHRADGRTLQFSGIEGIFSGKTPDGRSIVVTTRAQGGSTLVNLSVGPLGDAALSRVLFSGIETRLRSTPQTRATPQ